MTEKIGRAVAQVPMSVACDLDDCQVAEVHIVEIAADAFDFGSAVDGIDRHHWDKFKDKCKQLGWLTTDDKEHLCPIHNPLRGQWERQRQAREEEGRWLEEHRGD